MLAKILDRYASELRTGSCAEWATGGFSGAKLWRLKTELGEFCLRCWPLEHPSPTRLRWMHDTLAHAVRCGVSYVPAPVRTNAGETFVGHAGRLWELTPWLPGVANFETAPSDIKLRNAAVAVAKLHLAIATSPHGPNERQASPGIIERRDLLWSWLSGRITQLQATIQPRIWPAGFEAAIQTVSLFNALAPSLAGQLETATRLVVPLQPCVRDLWHDHVLFTNDEVTGIVDFGAMRGDNVTTDLARLLGSLVADDRTAWQTALAAYEQLRPLSAEERSLLTTFDQANVLLSGLNWLQWIYIERRHFADLPKIAQRLAKNVDRLRHLAEAK